MKRIAILGGAFDPIHIGHIKMVLHTANLNIFDEIWIMPCYKSNWGKNMLNHEHRLNMCKLTITNMKSMFNNHIIYISEYEIQNKLIGKTYYIVNRMEKDFPDYIFSFIIGQDNADNIDKWEQWEQIINNYQFVVYTRKGNKHKLWYKKEPHIYIDNNIPDISSTEIRNDFKHNAQFVCPDVIDYIRDNNLYKY